MSETAAGGAGGAGGTGDAGVVGVVVMSHGTPARPQDIAGFYTEIRRGRPPSPAQLDELRSRYRAIGGTSPLNAVTRRQAEAVAACLERRCPGRYVVRHGMRYCAPRIEEAVAALADAGAERLVGLVLAPHSSRAGVAEYARRAGAAAAALRRDGRGIGLTMVEHFYDSPGFAELVAGALQRSLAALAPAAAAEASVVFTAHSIPLRLVEEGDGYPEQVAQSAREAAEAAGLQRWRVAWQSAGRTGEPWLGPDVRQVVAEEAQAGTRAVVVCPIGFVADHLEVLYDIDVETRALAESLGLAFARTASFNDDPLFCDLLARVVVDADRRAAQGAGAS
jgi:ferrochelatase